MLTENQAGKTVEGLEKPELLTGSAHGGHWDERSRKREAKPETADTSGQRNTEGGVGEKVGGKLEKARRRKVTKY